MTHSRQNLRTDEGYKAKQGIYETYLFFSKDKVVMEDDWAGVLGDLQN
jgi:hypothetical protein